MKIYDIRIELKATIIPLKPTMAPSEQIEFNYLQTKLDYLSLKFKSICEEMLQFSMGISTLEDKELRK